MGFALTALLVAAPGRPCGPWFPSSILATDDAVVATPFTLLVIELRHRELLPASPFSAVGSRNAVRRVAQIERLEVFKAMGTNLPYGQRRTEVAAGHLAARQAILLHLAALEKWRRERRWSATGELDPPRPELGAVEVPPADRVPAEFTLYLKGAVAFHRGLPEAASEAWRDLLELPEEERRYRSTWAAYMLGRLAVGDDLDPLDPAAAERAFDRFRQTRELAAAGFADRLGLAADSLGWEARAAWRAGRFADAISLYAEQLSAGDEGAGISLVRVCRQLAAAGPEALGPVAAAELPREVFSLCLLDTGTSLEQETAWTEALRSAGAELASAGRLAWSAYGAGRFDAAARWAALAPGDEPLALWVRAKLHLRAGELEAALPLLDEVARRRPDYPSNGFGDESTPASGARAQAEAGTVALALGRYPDALDRLLRAGYWADAAHVAERVLTVDELVAYVDP